MSQDLFIPMFKLEKKLNIDHSQSSDIYNNFVINYEIEHPKYYKKRDEIQQMYKVWNRYVDAIYIQPVNDFHSLLDKTDLENRVIESAAKGDSDWTAHWLRTIRDITKTFYKCKQETYQRIKDDYFTIKKEAEELLDEKLQI